MPIDQGDREPELTARVVANRPGGPALSVRGRVRGKTSASFTVAHLWAQQAGNRILITDIDSQPSAAMPDDFPPAYTPIIIDGPPSSPYPTGGPVWEEALRTLGLNESEGRSQ
ncbi:ParA family protein [Streptomyces sp. NPDC051546]|uniref:ParA family protein n=1 Tax=Streptomyces sp. NPDC051546 TaxID=3365655 RepID=UPI0037A27ADE